MAVAPVSSEQNAFSFFTDLIDHPFIKISGIRGQILIIDALDVEFGRST